MIAGLHNHSFTNHVPELLLRYPVFLVVVAYDQGSFFDFHIRPTVSEFLRAACVQFVSAKVAMGRPTSKALCHGDGRTARIADRGLRIAESGFQILDSRFWIPRSAIRDPRSAILDPRSLILYP